MKNIRVGQLRVLTYSHIYTFPIPDPGGEQQAANTRPDLNAELRVVNDAFWVRLCAMGDLGFAEAYMYGDVECNDLVSLFQVRTSVVREKPILTIPCLDLFREPREPLKPRFPSFLPLYSASEDYLIPFPEYDWKLSFQHFCPL